MKIRKYLKDGPGSRGERGVEAISMLIVMPFLLVLILGLVDVGFMYATRLRFSGIVSDAARATAFDGGNFNPRTNTTGLPRDVQFRRNLFNNGRCVPSRCEDPRGAGGGVPLLTCTPQVVARAGDPVTCVGYYPYKPLNGGLLRGPLGMGIGTLLKPFRFEVVGRSETGING